MSQRFDQLAMSLLIFSTVLVIAIAVDPKGFALRDWQPMMAAILALGGAGIVYRGATLTYRAAMAKVDFDREVHPKENLQRERGIFLRTKFAALVVRDEARSYSKDMEKIDISNFLQELDPKDFVFRTKVAIDDAWSNLEVFPPRISDHIDMVKQELLNVENALARVAEQIASGPASRINTVALGDLRSALSAIAVTSDFLYSDLRMKVA
jgi:hypothetical protein